MLNNFKRITILFITIVLLSTGIFIFISRNVPIHVARTNASYGSFSSIDDLIAYADMIIVAKPQKSFYDCKPTIKNNLYGRIEDYYTVSSFKVMKVIKGDLSLKSIDILQPAAIITEGLGKKTLLITGDYYTVMEKDNKYLLFLKKVNNKDFYSVVCVEYGKYNLDKQDLNEKDITEKSSSYKKIKDSAIKRYIEIFQSAN